MVLPSVLLSHEKSGRAKASRRSHARNIVSFFIFVLLAETRLCVSVFYHHCSKILFKIGDVNAAEKWVECTGEVQYVEFEYDHATLPANNAALVIFPNGGINGASEDFVITKLEFTNGVNYLDARTGWVNNDKDAYTITEPAPSVIV